MWNIRSLAYRWGLVCLSSGELATRGGGRDCLPVRGSQRGSQQTCFGGCVLSSARSHGRVLVIKWGTRKIHLDMQSGRAVGDI